MATFVVITEDLKAGIELWTSYGTDYGKRGYKPTKMKQKYHDAMENKAYGFVDGLGGKSVDKNETPVHMSEPKKLKVTTIEA